MCQCIWRKHFEGIWSYKSTASFGHPQHQDYLFGITDDTWPDWVPSYPSPPGLPGRGHRSRSTGSCRGQRAPCPRCPAGRAPCRAPWSGPRCSRRARREAARTGSNPPPSPRRLSRTHNTVRSTSTDICRSCQNIHTIHASTARTWSYLWSQVCILLSLPFRCLNCRVVGVFAGLLHDRLFSPFVRSPTHTISLSLAFCLSGWRLLSMVWCGFHMMLNTSQHPDSWLQQQIV